ncbi:MAG: hypothetical protein QNJ51_27770 [Calothrix sp. MO_167.B12]|nr:hypothetical protein [Calothrix sp. MO_167.B12]
MALGLPVQKTSHSYQATKRVNFTVNRQPSTVNRQLSTVNCQPSTINR